MCTFSINEITEYDLDEVLSIYNSNSSFLKSHIGTAYISKEFIVQELDLMKKMGFKSVVIKNPENSTIAVSDFKIAEETYLSLFVLDASYKEKGFGSRIYCQLENIFKSKGSTKVRIDVVYDYKDTSLGFWEKQGFVPCEKILLEWNGFHSHAMKMLKKIS